MRSSRHCGRQDGRSRRSRRRANRAAWEESFSRCEAASPQPHDQLRGRNETIVWLEQFQSWCIPMFQRASSRPKRSGVEGSCVFRGLPTAKQPQDSSTRAPVVAKWLLVTLFVYAFRRHSLNAFKARRRSLGMTFISWGIASLELLYPRAECHDGTPLLRKFVSARLCRRPRCRAPLARWPRRARLRSHRFLSHQRRADFRHRLD